MEAKQLSERPLPAVSYLRIPEKGEPYLEGHQCRECNAIFLGERSACAKCGARDRIDVIKLANRGRLYSYCIVNRSYPGIDVPYISAIVDLDGGGTVKGNLINIEADPKKLTFDMPVEVIYKDALGRKDKKGNSYLSYFFQAIESSETAYDNHRIDHG